MGDEILKDWTAFCEGRQDFDKSHFYTLFMEQKDPEYFRQAFMYFSCAGEFLVRMGRILGFGEQENVTVRISSPDDAMKYALTDLQERIRIAEKYDEPDLVAELSHLNPRFCENFEEVYRAGFSDLQSWQLETVGDWFLDHLASNDPKTFAILEAFYGLTSNLELKWFLGSPLLDEELNLDSYVELWKAGADYAVKDGELLVASRKPLG